MEINGVPIEDTHAEAFAMPFARLIITGRNGKWTQDVSRHAAGCATSIIGCGCEAGVEAHTPDFKTPDGRPGDRLLVFARTAEALHQELIKRVGQVCLPAPTIQVFNGLDTGASFALGEKLGYFGNGFQRKEKHHGRDCVAIPCTGGDFVVEKLVNLGDGVGGANFWIYAQSNKSGLRVAEKAVEAIVSMPGLILPFASGVVAAASRLGSKYPFLTASTQEDYCPTIPAAKNPNRKLPPKVEAVFEIVIDAVSRDVAEKAMAAGIRAACGGGGVVKIGAANFGGKLGEINLSLPDILARHP